MQRKRSKSTRQANTAEKKFIVWMKHKDCSYCGNPGPSRYDHCAGSAAKIKLNFSSVLIGPFFGLAECACCANMTHHEKYDAFGPHHKIWLREVEDYPEDIPLEVIDGIIEYGRRYRR